MKRIYYDNLDNLVKELKEYGIGSIEIDKENPYYEVIDNKIVEKKIVS